MLGRELSPDDVIRLLSTLGGRIALKRHELNVTQETLASRLNVSQSLVSMWERDVERPMADTMSDLAVALQTTREWLTSSPAPAITKASA